MHCCSIQEIYRMSNIQTVNSSYLGDMGGSYGLSRMDGENTENTSTYRRIGMASKGEGTSCGAEVFRDQPIRNWHFWKIISLNMGVLRMKALVSVFIFL